MAEEAEIERLRAQRTRFIAFAFAGNDVLVELDADGTVCYCGGTVEHLLARESQALRGLAIHDIIDPSDMLLFDELLVRLRRTGRLDRIPLRFSLPDGRNRTLGLSAFMMPERPDSTYIALSPSKAEAPDDAALARPVEAENFAASVRDKIRSGEISESAQLTMLDLTAEKLSGRLSGEQVDEFMASVMKYLRAWSVGGDTVGRLDNGTVGLVHDGGLKEEEINDRLNHMLQMFDPDPQAPPLDLQAASVTLDAESLTDDDLSKAIVYTMNAFARNGADFALESLSTGYQTAMEETLNKVATFRRAITGDNLRLVFQPIVDLQSWQVHHYEALARLNNGERLLPPSRLIGFAEEFGVVAEMDLAVMKRAFAILTTNRGIRSGARIAVNLSGRSVLNDEFTGTLVRMMRENEHLLPRLMFEVTESHEMTDLDRAAAVLKRLRGMGCAVCIDDFGAGAAAFPYLKALEVDYIKIDGSYIRDAFNTRHGRPFLRCIAGLARDLGTACIGEMVENSDTMWLLRELGVGYGQGWFFGKPASDVSTFTLSGKPQADRVVTAG